MLRLVAAAAAVDGSAASQQQFLESLCAAFGFPLLQQQLQQQQQEQQKEQQGVGEKGCVVGLLLLRLFII